MGCERHDRKRKKLAGELYDPSKAELTPLLIKARKPARRYNQTDEDESKKRTAILRELLPNTPNLPSLQAPIYFDYGCNTTDQENNKNVDAKQD